jgi:transcriptional regulator with XRE-family HTH domain
LKEKNIYQIIGARIKDIRESKGMTQLDVAVILNYDKTTISRIEAGRTNITIRTLQKLSIALEVPMKELIDI